MAIRLHKPAAVTGFNLPYRAAILIKILNKTIPASPFETAFVTSEKTSFLYARFCRDCTNFLSLKHFLDQISIFLYFGLPYAPT